MITPELISYIKIERAKSTPDSMISANLSANGWKDEDISEAMKNVTIDNTIPEPQISMEQLRAIKQQKTWIIFGTIACVDFFIILFFKLIFNTYGLFGISIGSIFFRAIAFYVFAYFFAEQSVYSKYKISSSSAGNSMMKMVGSMVLTAFILIGVFFGGCLLLIGL